MLARIGGVLYLIIIAIGLVGELFVRERLVVSGNPEATAAQIRSMEWLWRLGIAGELVLLTCGITLALIFLVLLRPVSRDLALLAVFFNLVSLTVEASSSLYLTMALFPLHGPASLDAFSPAQLHTLMTLAIRSHGQGFGVALIFFGWFCLVAGVLIVRSGYLPRWIGVLMLLAGLSYLINSFALILAPALASRLFPAILVPAFIGELSLALWMLIKGVNLEGWRRRTHPA